MAFLLALQTEADGRRIDQLLARWHGRTGGAGSNGALLPEILRKGRTDLRQVRSDHFAASAVRA